MERQAYPFDPDELTTIVRKLEEWELPANHHHPQSHLTAHTICTYCGLRNGEANSSLGDWVIFSSDPDKAATLRIPNPDDYTTDTFDPKTTNGSRTVPLASQWTDHSTGDTFDVTAPDRAADYLNTVGKIDLSNQSIRNSFQRLCREIELEDGIRFGRGYTTYKAGPFDKVPRVYVHDLRASWCTHLIRSDVNQYTIRDKGGWENLKMVNRYASYVGDPGGEISGSF